jgi:hypothetical protein
MIRNPQEIPNVGILNDVLESHLRRQWLTFQGAVPVATPAASDESSAVQFLHTHHHGSTN